MSLFRKVIGKSCPAPKNECELSGGLRDSSEFLCEKCNRELLPVTRTNAPAVLAVVLAVLLLCGGAAYFTLARTGWFGGSGAVVVAGDTGKVPAANLRLSYALQMAGDDQPQTVSPTYVFHSGDRFRLLVKSAEQSNALYVFYEDRASGRMQALYPAASQARGIGTDETVTIPPGDGAWMRMDKTPGAEHLVVIVSANPLTELPVDAAGCTTDDFEQALKRIGKGQSVREAKSAPGPEWTEASAAGAGVLVARLVVQHQ